MTAFGEAVYVWWWPTPSITAYRFNKYVRGRCRFTISTSSIATTRRRVNRFRPLPRVRRQAMPRQPPRRGGGITRTRSYGSRHLAYGAIMGRYSNCLVAANRGVGANHHRAAFHRHALIRGGRKPGSANRRHNAAVAATSLPRGTLPAIRCCRVRPMIYRGRRPRELASRRSAIAALPIRATALN